MNENFMKVNAKIFCILKTERAIEIEDFGFQNSVLFFRETKHAVNFNSNKNGGFWFPEQCVFFFLKLKMLLTSTASSVSQKKAHWSRNQNPPSLIVS